MHLSYLGPVSCFQILSFLSSGLTIGSGYSLMAARWQVFFIAEFPQGSPAHCLWWLQLLMTVTSFIYRYDRTYSISQLAMQINFKKFKCLENIQTFLSHSWLF